MPRAFGHARSRVSTLNRVLARQEKEIIENRTRGMLWAGLGPSGATTKLGLPARTLDSKIKRFKIAKLQKSEPAEICIDFDKRFHFAERA